jgi:hypothetical protein
MFNNAGLVGLNTTKGLFKDVCILLLKHYQSNRREYIVFANPSLLTVAPSGSRLLFITSSGVTITRLRSASSSADASHLK